MRAVKAWVKRKLAYEPLEQTSAILSLLNSVRKEGLPYCPANEGDFLFAMVSQNHYRACLETGFYTGSTALYMAAAVAQVGGRVVSIGMDDDDTVARAMELLRQANLCTAHSLIRENSNSALAKLFLNGEKFDFIYMDGWKTFDHVAYEIYLFNQLLSVGGAIVFDDAYMPSVDKAIQVLKSHYRYEEVDYSKYNQSTRDRVFQIMTRRTFKRPYRGFRKTLETEDQPAFRDWNFSN